MTVVATVNATDAKNRFGDLIRRAYQGKGHLIVERGGIPVVAIVPISDYQQLLAPVGTATGTSAPAEAAQRAASGAVEAQAREQLLALRNLQPWSRFSFIMSAMTHACPRKYTTMERNIRPVFYGLRITQFSILGLTILLLTGACAAQKGSPIGGRPPTQVAQAGPTLNVNPAGGWAGQYVEIRGSGWPTNQLILVYLEDETGRSGFMAASNSDANGDLTTGFTWPLSERWLQPGPVRMVARSSNGDSTAGATFQIGRPGEETPTPIPTVEETPIPDEADPPTPTPTVAPIAQAPVATEHVEAARLASPPVIDGNLDEWAGVQSYSSPFIVEQRPEWDGSLDVEALWRLGWDDDALYFGVAVTDDLIVQENIPQFAYFGDSLEIEMATDIANRGDVVTRRDFQYVITPGNFNDLPPAAYRFQGNDEGRLIDAPGTLARVAARRTDSGYNLEFSIPWSDINVRPHSGFSLGAALNVNDNDVPGSQRIQYLMLSNVPERQWSTPSSWGTLNLR